MTRPGDRRSRCGSARCLGLSCLRCEISCPENVFQFTEFLTPAKPARRRARRGTRRRRGPDAW